MVNWIRRMQWYKKSSPRTRAVFWVVAFILLLNIVFIPVFLMFSHVSFLSVEDADLKNKLQNGRDVIQQEIDEVSTITKDKANWDATYEFVKNPDVAYVLNNFDDNTFKNLNMNYFAIVNNNGIIVYTKTLDFRDGEPTPINFNTVALLNKYPQLIAQNSPDGEGVKGLILTNNKILLVNSRPILTSNFLGPSRGTLIFGRFLDAREDDKLTRIAHFSLLTQNLVLPVSSNEMQLANYALTGEETAFVDNGHPVQCSVCHQVTRGSLQLAAANPSFISPVNDAFLGGYTLLYDMEQTPIAIMGIHIPRDIEQLESRYSSLFLLSFLGLLAIVGFIGVNIITRTIASEEALDREYKLTRAVIDNVPQQIYAHDINGRYLLNNLRDAQMMGVANPEDLLGKSDFDYYPPELAVEFQKLEKQVTQSGAAIVDKEDVISRADGKQYWISTTKSPMRDAQGQITGIVGVTRDITKRKQREREMEVIVLMSRALRSAETSTTLLAMIYNQVIDLLHADFGTLELIDPAGGDAEVVYSYGFDNPLMGMRTPFNKGFNSYIRTTHKPYLDNCLAENPMALDMKVYNGCIAIAGAPMIAEEQLIGLIWMGRKSVISEDELRLLAAMADIAASSIRRVTLHELTEKRLSQITSLRKIDTSINNSKDLGMTLGVLLEQTCQQLQVDAADVLLCKHDSELLEFQFGQGFRTGLFDRQFIRMNESPAGEAAQTKELVLIGNLAELGNSHSLANASLEEGFISYFAVPLLVRNEIKGVMEVFFRREFTPDRDWVNFLETLAGQAAIAIEQVQLFQGLQHSNQELVQAYDETIEGWVRALDMRDKETEGHSLRVMQLCVNLAAEFEIEGEELIHVRRGALLHDIGKVGVPDHILLKPGKLTDEEWVIMRRHPQLAFDMLSPINYLHPALTIPYCHHEKWDGSGYPRGLKSEEIPLAARIFAIVDVWDALSNDRPYRKAWSKEEILKYIQEQSGTHFDPIVVDAFLRMI
jgi:PAS domain S-box-containing protein